MCTAVWDYAKYIKWTCQNQTWLRNTLSLFPWLVFARETEKWIWACKQGRSPTRHGHCVKGLTSPLFSSLLAEGGLKVSPCLSNYQCCVKKNPACVWQDGLVLHSEWPFSQMWQSASHGSRSHYPSLPRGGMIVFRGFDLFLNGSGSTRTLWEATWQANPHGSPTATQHQTWAKKREIILAFTSVSICSMCAMTHFLSSSNQGDPGIAHGLHEWVRCSADADLWMN